MFAGVHGRQPAAQPPLVPPVELLVLPPVLTPPVVPAVVAVPEALVATEEPLEVEAAVPADVLLSDEEAPVLPGDAVEPQPARSHMKRIKESQRQALIIWR